MDCGWFKSQLPAYRNAELDDADRREVASHLEGCDGCRTEAHEFESCLSLLDHVDEITPSPEVWTRLKKEINTEAPAFRRKPVAAPVWIAAAASIMVAVLSFYFVASAPRGAVAATVATIEPGSTLAPGHPVRPGEIFTTASFVVLALPQVGTLKVNRGSELRFENPRRVTLLKGEVFAEIIPSGRGFEIASEGTRVTVHGTRFGVRAGGATPTVYVVEGHVTVDAPAGRMALRDRQMITVGGLAKALEDESLRWIAAYETPAVALAARAPDVLAKGEDLPLTVRFLTSSPAPVLLAPQDDLVSQLHIKITDPAGKSYLARVSPDSVMRADLRTLGTHGRVRLDVSTPCELVLRLDPKLFPAAGRYTLSVTFQPDKAAPAELWNRSIESAPLALEVN